MNFIELVKNNGIDQLIYYSFTDFTNVINNGGIGDNLFDKVNRLLVREFKDTNIMNFDNFINLQYGSGRYIGYSTNNYKYVGERQITFEVNFDICAVIIHINNGNLRIYKDRIEITRCFS